MVEFKDKIGAAAGKVEFLYEPGRGIAAKVSGMVALSMDGRHLLGEIPATGIGVEAVYPQPSVVTFIQSDAQGMWGRNCPACQKYFRTNHVMGETCCPYCGTWAPGLAFMSKDQRKYITTCYDAFARAFREQKSTAVEFADITDSASAWHYSEEKQQFHFECAAAGCKMETDILGEYGFCPRCGRTNARKLFLERVDKTLLRWADVDKNVAVRQDRSRSWEEMTKNIVGDFEHLAKHLRLKLLHFPMTTNRRKRLEDLNFQQPLQANELLVQWFDIGLLEWRGNATSPKRAVQDSDLPLIKKMIQRRHILIHNGGIADEDYLSLSGDTQVQLGERVHIRSNEVKRFIELVRTIAENLVDNVEHGFEE
jgi:hypothetical protein